MAASINILLIEVILFTFKKIEDILFTFKQGLTSEGYNVEAFVDPTETFTHFVIITWSL